MSRYKQVVSGEWYDLEKKWDLQCCQCGLVHTVYIRVYEGMPQIRMDVNERATKGVRSRKRKCHVKKHS